MFNQESSSNCENKVGNRFQKPNIFYNRNPVQHYRRPFPLLRRRVMSYRYPNMGFRPLRPVIRTDCSAPRDPRERKPDFRNPSSTNCTVRVPPFPATTSNNQFDNVSQQYPALRPPLVNYPINQTVESSDCKPQFNDPNILSDVWVETLAPTGRKYYYNARTRIVTWERPMNVRIIDLNEIKRLQNFSIGEQIQNSPNGSQNIYMHHQPPSSCGNSFAPINFSMLPRLIMFPPPQNVCNPSPAPIFPVSPGEQPILDSSNYRFSSVPSPLFSFPVISGNLSSNSSNVNYNLSSATTKENSDFLESHLCSISNASSSSENKISNWGTSDSQMQACMHGTINQEKKETAHGTFTEQDTFRSDNSTQNKTPNLVPSDEKKYSDVSQSTETKWPPFNQLTEMKKENTDETQNNSNVSTSGTNCPLLSVGKENDSFLDTQHIISVLENSDKLADIAEMNKSGDASKESEQNAVQDENVSESGNCNSEKYAQTSNTEKSPTKGTECTSSEQAVENRTEVDKSRPVSSTPIAGTPWFVVWTGDERVFYYDSQRKTSVWERPNDLLNRYDVDKLILKSPLSLGIVPLKKEVRKIEFNSLDTIKKLKKENQTENSDGNVSIESDNLNKEEKVKLENIPHEEKVKIFCEMLSEKKVSAFSTWEKELHKIVFDSRYLLLPSKERKQVFEAFILRKMEEEKILRKKELQNQKEKFLSLLKEAGVTSKSRFSDIVQRYGKDVRFKAVERIKQRENIFNQYVLELEKKEKGNERYKTELKKKFLELLREQNFINAESTWDKVQANISEDERFKAIQSSSFKEKIFKDYINRELTSTGLSKDREDRITISIRNREEEVRRNLSVHLQERDRERDLHKHMSATTDFKALLNDLVRNSDINWHAAKKILKGDRRWDLSLCLSSQEREELFNEHIASLNNRKKEQFYHLLDEIPEITLKTSWLDVRKTVLKDPRCTKFSSSERKCEKEFKEYLKLKLVAAKVNFKELLKETKIITYKSKSLLSDTKHLKDIEDALSHDKRYLNLECIRSERKEMLLAYINKLHEDGPPPPPTATDPSNRPKIK